MMEYPPAAGSQRLRILIVSIPELGHCTPLMGPARELLARGHHVSVASLSKIGPKIMSMLPDATFISVGDSPLSEEEERRAFRVMSDHTASKSAQLDVLTNVLWGLYPDVMLKGLVAYLQDPRTLRPDVMVVDIATSAGLEAAEMFQIPVAVVNHIGGIDSALVYMGHRECAMFKHVPIEDMSLGVYPAKMSAWQRNVMNPLLRRLQYKIYKMLLLPATNKRREQYGMAPITSFRHYRTAFSRCAVLNGTSWLQEVERPMPPHFHMTGPLGVDFSNPAAIPVMGDEQVLDFIDAAMAEGEKVVYVATGTVAVLGAREVAAIARGLQRVQGVRFVWSLRRDMWPLLPEEVWSAGGCSRVLVVPWANQVAVLFHPDVSAFVTHGGTSSTNEGMACGKPLLCIPFLGDQFANAQHIVNRGVGLSLHPARLTATRLARKVERILTNPAFAKAAATTGAELRTYKGPSTAASLIEAVASGSAWEGVSCGGTATTTATSCATSNRSSASGVCDADRLEDAHTPHLVEACRRLHLLASSRLSSC